MNKFLITLFTLVLFSNPVLAEGQEYSAENFFHIGQMNSHDENFSLYFKTRDKAVLARGENFNYITDFPQDLYIYDYKSKTSSPLISYEEEPSFGIIRNITSLPRHNLRTFLGTLSSPINCSPTLIS